jgi:hypothetical protein
MAKVGKNLLDLVLSNFDGVDINNAEFGMLTPDYYHPHLVIDLRDSHLIKPDEIADVFCEHF